MNRLTVAAAVLAAATLTGCAPDTETGIDSTIERGSELYQPTAPDATESTWPAAQL